MKNQEIQAQTAARAAKLVLEDGSEFEGVSFGKARGTDGELVFTTGMTGYVQSLTDPSFHGQILTCTYPLVGNYGVPLQRRSLEPYVDEQGIPLHWESLCIHTAGLVVSEWCEQPSHFAASVNLALWLEHNNVPGIAGIDTRALTVRLRESGVMRAKILVEGEDERSIDSNAHIHPVAEVSRSQPRVYRPASVSADERLPRVVLVDCGAKANLLRCLLARNLEVIAVPWNHDLSNLDYDGLFLSNGPGDPKMCGKTIAAVRRAFDEKKPMFGVCLGNQIMALAAGADTYKLPYGHRGQNQPCIEAGTKRCYITSQNHGYAVRADSLPSGWEPWFYNANDNTIEGIRSLTDPFCAVQFHPEGCPGPRDTEFLIDHFVARLRTA
jgi:carbamoyl-phosphate synthase small subunit